jgi:hypothetical protein
MAVLPGVLGCRLLRRTVQVRLGINTLRFPGGTPILFALAALRSVPQAGSQFRGLATAIHKISGLRKSHPLKALGRSLWSGVFALSEVSGPLPVAGLVINGFSKNLITDSSEIPLNPPLQKGDFCSASIKFPPLLKKGGLRGILCCQLLAACWLLGSVFRSP